MSWKHIDLIDIVEAYAFDNDLIESEQELSAKFDEEVAPLVIAQYGEDDSVAMSEAFNDWSDSLCKDGDIHPEQYDKYCYVGKYQGD